MSYTPKTWVYGELITANDMNHLEQGVANEQIGPQGPQGPAGPGLPAGGTTGQLPVKRSGTDYDTQWRTLTSTDVGALPAGDVEKIRAVTKAEWAALTEKDPRTLYLIKEADNG